MTVKQLIKKLNNVPQNYDIVIFNDSVFVDGPYKAEGVDVYDDCKQVEISTSHNHLCE